MTPELQALIEAVGVWQTRGRRDALAQADVATAYDAYMASLNTPPSCLPPAPRGKKWVRVEYTTGGICGDASLQNCDPSTPAVALEDYVLSWNDRWVPVYLESSCADGVMPSFARGRGFGWRLVDDPNCDSLEKIAEEFERAAYAHRVLLNPAAYADRIRALIGEGQK